MRIENNRLLIQKRTLPEYLTYVIFMMPFLLSFLQDTLNLPSFVKYIIDVAWVGAFLSLLFVRRAYLKREITPLMTVVTIFFLLTLCVYILNFQSPFYYLWGIRNNFRFYVAFMAFTVFFSIDDIRFCLRLIESLFWINTVVVLFQFFVLGLKQDYLGGIFGVDRGCNGSLIVFFVITTARSVLSFFNKRESMVYCFSKCAITLVIAAMAELKFFFLVFMIIVVMASIVTKFSWRKVLIYIFSGFVVMLGSTILVEVFGENRSLEFDNLLKLIFSSNYSSSRDLGRFTALPTISKFYLTEPLEKIFGLGLGNCDTSAFAICNTPFYQTHYFLNYTWLSSAFLFLETGYLGLFIFLVFFIVCFFLAYKKRKRKKGNEFFCQMAMIMSVVCVILTFYNSSLRAETGYMAYFVLAMPFVHMDTQEE